MNGGSGEEVPKCPGFVQMGDEEDGIPAAKKIRTTKDLKDNQGSDEEIFKVALKNVYDAVMSRIDGIEKKISTVVSRCHSLQGKLEMVAKSVLGGDNSGSDIQEGTSSIVDANVSVLDEKNKKDVLPTAHSSKSGVNLISLNTEADYPSGSWLGDENNLEQRVRCPISSAHLEIINNSPTPEKMALSLLDFLFDRETQAYSNISGHGKHGKKQLDPLFIYGIRCHLAYKFDLTEKTWQRIKQNLDSKCRTAFRRKLRGMSLKVKAFEDRFSAPYVNVIKAGDAQSSAEHSDSSVNLLLTGLVSLPSSDMANVKTSVITDREMSQLNGPRLCSSDLFISPPPKEHNAKDENSCEVDSVDQFSTDYSVDVCHHHHQLMSTVETLNKEHALIGFEDGTLGVLAVDSISVGIDQK